MGRRVSIVWVLVAPILLALVLALPAGGSAQVIDGINQTQQPIFLVFDPCCVGTIGWYYTPGFDYTLTGVQTVFRAVPNASAFNRTVTLGVYSERPAAGGVLLRSGTFQSSAATGVFAGVTFTGLPVTAGTRYFIGLLDVAGLGVNLPGCTGSAATGDPPAFNTPQCVTVNPPPGITNLGTWTLDANTGTAGVFDSGVFDDFTQLFAQPILRFLGQMVPQPVSVLSPGSAGLGGAPADGQSANPRVSADGRYVVFDSAAGNLSPTCPTGVRQVYRSDRATGAIQCVSLAAGGVPGDGASSLPAVSGDGRFVAYQSLAPNLGCGSGQQVLRADLVTGQTACVSRTGGGVPGDAASGAPAISADGRLVAYQSLAQNLAAAAGCANGRQQVLRTDVDAGETVCASQAGGVPGNDASGAPAISESGRFVAYHSLATNLAPPCTNGQQHVLRADLAGGAPTCLSRVPGAVGNGPSAAPAISADGVVVAFESTASNLDPGCPAGVRQIFVSRGGNALCFSRTAAGAPGDGPSQDAALSGDGLVLAFATTATNLAAGAAALGTRGAIAQIGAAAQIVRGSAGQAGAGAGNGLSARPSLSLTGAVGAFQTTASNLVSGDTNGTDDVLVTTQAPPPATLTAPPNGATFPLTAPTPITFAWTPVPGATRYGFEFTGPDRAFANPGGSAPDAVNGFGGAGGGVVVSGTTLPTVLDPSFPPGTYQVRVAGLNAAGLVGPFGPAITLILGPAVYIPPTARPEITVPGPGAALVPGTPATFTWSLVPGVAQYLFEVSGPGRAFANPNGTTPDPGALASVVVPGTTLMVASVPALPSGTYQVRVIALTAAGQPVGTFSNALTLGVP
jgi:hypothetical protein